MKRKFQLLKPLVRKPGIYIISCTETDKIYIGESLKDRINEITETAGHFNKSV